MMSARDEESPQRPTVAVEWAAFCALYLSYPRGDSRIQWVTVDYGGPRPVRLEESCASVASVGFEIDIGRVDCHRGRLSLR